MSKFDIKPTYDSDYLVVAGGFSIKIYAEGGSRNGIVSRANYYLVLECPYEHALVILLALI